MKTNETVKAYLLFMIDKKEITGRSWRNRPASDFYRFLKQDSVRYNVTVFEVLNSQAELVMNGKYVALS